MLREMSRYDVIPEVMDQVADSFLAFETDSANSSGSDKEELKEEIQEIMREYKGKRL